MAVSEHLDAFVKQALERGIDRAKTERALVDAGWPPDQVRKALAVYAVGDFPIPVPRPVPSVSARDAFVYAVLFGALILSAYQLGALIFQIIDWALPDPASRSSQPSVGAAMRWPLASLMVAFPVFLLTARAVESAVGRDRTRRLSRVRQWLTYLTLFIASCVLVGNVTTLLYYFLGGELTLRFLLKVLTVAMIAGGVFLYYFADVQAADAEPAN
jgi:hypothetical protein